MKRVRIVVSVLLFATAGVSYGTSVMENKPVISVKKFKRERYKHPVVLETGSDIEESQSSDFGPSAGGFRKNPMPWLYEDSDDTGAALTDQPDEKIYNDISKNMFIYNVAF